MAILHDWDFWARPDQRLPVGDWLVWLALAGRGWGKTRVGAEAIRDWVRGGAKRIHLVAPTAADYRDVMIEGESGLLSVCAPWENVEWEPSKRRLTWHDAAGNPTSMATCFSAEKPGRLRGPQCEKLWADEVAEWKYPEAWDQAMFGLRLGNNPQAVVTTTPKPKRVIKDLKAAKTTHLTQGSTYDNIANLAPTFVQTILAKYEGTTLGQQEIYAILLEEMPGALWNRADIDAGRVHQLPPLKRIVIAIDPATTSEKDSDETGIIVAGLGANDLHAYVLEDLSGIWTPNQWATRVIDAYRRWNADRVIGETNNGGDLIENTIRSTPGGESLPYTKIHAKQGKFVRAEPVQGLYEQGRVHHVGTHADLEDQMVNWVPHDSDESPDRLDANVYAIRELLLGGNEVASKSYVRGASEPVYKSGDITLIGERYIDRP